MKKIIPNQENCSEEELERAIKLAKNGIEKIRLLSIHMLLREMTVLEISKILCVSDVTVYKWIHRFNCKGLDGLITRQKGGRPRLVRLEEFKKLLNIFDEPQKVGQIHWTAKKFHGHLKKELGIECDYSTVLKYLKEAKYALKYGRSWPVQPEGNEERREEFIKQISSHKNDLGVKIWYMDESGFDGDPRARRGWSKKGERKKIYRTQKHLRINVSGMCCPATGEFFALEFPYTDSVVFQAFLDNANKEIVPNGNKEIIVLDNASWHKTKKIAWGRFTPLYLPPYSPDLNPIERIWGYLKENYFNDFSAKNLDELATQLDIALLSLLNDKKIVSRVAKT